MADSRQIRRHSLPVPAAIRLAGLIASLPPALFLFRRDRSDEERTIAFEELFDTLRAVYESAALLKEPWIVQWEERGALRLPPKYEEAFPGHPAAIQAARDLRFATALLQRNRWSSKVLPLFETVDTPAWSRVERTLQQISPALLSIQDSRYDVLRGDESGWIDHAVERFDEVRLRLRALERQDAPLSERVSTTTFGMVHSASQLSHNLLERLREDIIEE